MGYNSLFEKRNGLRGDGCAMFFKTRFDLVDKIRLNLDDSKNLPFIPSFARHLFEKDNIGVISCLFDSVSNQQLVVANTQLVWKEEEGAKFDLIPLFHFFIYFIV